MKKQLLLVAVLLCSQSNVMYVNAQTKGSKPEVMNNQLDSLAYTMGMAQTQGLKEYLSGKLEVDTTYINDFIKGLKASANSTDKQENAYFAGIQIGQQISNQMMKGVNQELFGKDSKQSISKELFLNGFIAGVLGKGGLMSVKSAQDYVQANIEKIKEESLEQTYGANKEAGIKFLAENKQKEGIVTTPSGLQYKIVTKGIGEIPKVDSKVKVHYKGTFLDGTEFDSSYKRNEPITISANQVIKGWTEALTLMPVGSKWILYVPQELAYGSKESGPIKPFSTLIFEVELLSIEKPASK